MKPEFIVWKSVKDNQWYFDLKAANGKIILASEGYRRRGNALKGIQAIIKCCKTARIVYV